MSDAVMYAVIYISLGLLIFYVVSGAVVFVIKARQAAILRRTTVLPTPMFERPVEVPAAPTWVPGKNRILSYDPNGMAFLVRARHLFEIVGGEGFYFPFEVQRLSTDLFLVWDGPQPDPYSTDWNGLKGKYSFVPCPESQADGGEFAFVQEVK